MVIGGGTLKEATTKLASSKRNFEISSSVRSDKIEDIVKKNSFRGDPLQTRI